MRPISVLAPVGDHFGDSLALHDQGPRIDVGQIVAAGPRARDLLGRRAIAGQLADRHRFAREQRLVGLQVAAREKDGVGRHTVALGDEHDVAAHDLSPRDAQLLAPADHPGARAGQVAQRLQRALRLALLVDRDAHDHEHEAQEHDGLLEVAEDRVEPSGEHQQQEHGLPRHAEGYRQEASLLGRWKLVVPLRPQPLGGLGGGEALRSLPSGQLSFAAETTENVAQEGAALLRFAGAGAVRPNGCRGRRDRRDLSDDRGRGRRRGRDPDRGDRAASEETAPEPLSSAAAIFSISPRSSQQPLQPGHRSTVTPNCSISLSFSPQTGHSMTFSFPRQFSRRLPSSDPRR